MMSTLADEAKRGRPLRLWPGVLAVMLQWLVRFAVPYFDPEAIGVGVTGGLAGGLAVAVWWLFFSRAPWSERLGCLVLMTAAMIGTSLVVHESIATGMMGLMLVVYATPVLSLAFVAWAVASRSLSSGRRRATLVASLVLACGVWTLVRTGGFTAELDQDFAWRWAETPEDRLLVRSDEEPMAAPPPPDSAANSAPWPGFRGPLRDGVVRRVRIGVDWSTAPPVELWRRPVGPGWSSFAVGGGLVYTQEQRGEEEVVGCYRLETGEPVWRHRDPVRFWESNAGAGPRGTPTLAGGRVHAFGATGILNVLDARDGTVAWSRDVATDTGSEVPTWGFSSSPLVTNEIVIVAAAGTLAAYDRATGEPRWIGPKGGNGYSSPHPAVIDGVEQVLLLGAEGAISVAPANGTILWQHPWPGEPIVQPALLGNGELLINAGDRSGLRRLAVTHGSGGWTAEEVWTSVRMKPFFNDFVIHDGHAFGFDGVMLACIDLEDGRRRWKGGRYGRGQLVLLADPGLLLVLTEQGDLALVAARPDQFQELARMPAIESKTWNHPVLVGDLLLVRNAEEMAAFKMPLAGS